MAQITINNTGTVQVTTTINAALHVEGIYIKDDQNNTVSLRGVNAGGFGDTASGWFSTSWNENTVRSNLAAMQSWGINCMRIMGTARWWLENTRENLQGSDVCTQSHRESIIRTIELAEEYGIYVIFTFWSIDTVGSRSPGIQDYLPYPPRSSSQNYNTIRDSADWVELWGGDSATSSFLPRFRNVDSSGTPPTTSLHVHNNGVTPPSVSEALQNYPNVIYEFYNEPSGDNSGWSTVTQQCVDAIRAGGDNHPIMVQCGYCMSFYGGPNWFDTMYNKLSSRTNIIYSSHIYRSDGSFPGNPYLYNDIYNMMMTTPAPNGFGCGYVQSKNVPVIIGEVGNRAWSDQDYTYLDSTLRVMNENGISWAAWEWRSGALYSGSFTPTQTGEIVRTYASGP
jgi:hypothetical protein